MPLLIVAVALAIFIWSRQSEERHLQDVEEATRDLCDALYHSHVDAPLPELARQMGVTRSIADRIQLEFNDAQDRKDISATVRAGDTAPPFGDGRATHHAVIFINHQPRLGLRLIHHGEARNVVVLGYWVINNASP
jgi:hypothetical protein